MTSGLNIQGDTIISDIATTNIEVSNSSTLTIYGIVNGQITIEKSSKVVIHGMVNGDIINNGFCKIFGTVNGRLYEDGGTFEVDTNALINHNF